MPYGYGFGRGRGRGGGMGFGGGGGMGLGFRGSSPPWPYVGRGRGGLPRCGYFFRGGDYPGAQFAARGEWAGYGPAAAPAGEVGGLAGREELGYLQEEARAIKEQLDSIESRMRELQVEE